MKIVSFPFKFRRCVNFICHDPTNGLQWGYSIYYSFTSSECDWNICTAIYLIYALFYISYTRSTFSIHSIIFWCRQSYTSLWSHNSPARKPSRPPVTFMCQWPPMISLPSARLYLVPSAPVWRQLRTTEDKRLASGPGSSRGRSTWGDPPQPGG